MPKKSYYTQQFVNESCQISCYNTGSQKREEHGGTVSCYLALRETQSTDWHGLLIQLNSLNVEHLPPIVDSLVDIAVVYQEKRILK